MGSITPRRTPQTVGFGGQPEDVHDCRRTACSQAARASVGRAPRSAACSRGRYTFSTAAVGANRTVVRQFRDSLREAPLTRISPTHGGYAVWHARGYAEGGRGPCNKDGSLVRRG